MWWHAADSQIKPLSNDVRWCNRILPQDYYQSLSTIPRFKRVDKRRGDYKSRSPRHPPTSPYSMEGIGLCWSRATRKHRYMNTMTVLSACTFSRGQVNFTGWWSHDVRGLEKCLRKHRSEKAWDTLLNIYLRQCQKHFELRLMQTSYTENVFQYGCPLTDYTVPSQMLASPLQSPQWTPPLHC